MGKIQLKMPPDQVALLIESVNRDLQLATPDRDQVKLGGIRTWLQYRLDKYLTSHPGDTAT